MGTHSSAADGEAGNTDERRPCVLGGRADALDRVRPRAATSLEEAATGTYTGQVIPHNGHDAGDFSTREPLAAARGRATPMGPGRGLPGLVGLRDRYWSANSMEATMPSNVALVVVSPLWKPIVK